MTNGQAYRIHYFKSNAGRLTEIILGINLDLAGYYQGDTAYSLYECPVEIADSIRKALSSQENIVGGEPWYQSDHTLFVQNQVPALAITSERFVELSTYVTHTAKDSPEMVDPTKLVDIALALRDLLLDLGSLVT